MAITLNTVAYVRDAFINVNKLVYVAATQTMALKNMLVRGRTPPKASGTDPGVSRCETKRTKTVTINGAAKDIIAGWYVSVPVGALAADVDSVLDDIGDDAVSVAGKAFANTGTFDA